MACQGTTALRSQSDVAHRSDYPRSGFDCVRRRRGRTHVSRASSGSSVRIRRLHAAARDAQPPAAVAAVTTRTRLPVIAGGIEKIVNIKLTKEEQEMFDTSVKAVKGLVEACKGIDESLA